MGYKADPGRFFPQFLCLFFFGIVALSKFSCACPQGQNPPSAHIPVSLQISGWSDPMRTSHYVVDRMWDVVDAHRRNHCPQCHIFLTTDSASQQVLPHSLVLAVVWRSAVRHMLMHKQGQRTLIHTASANQALVVSCICIQVCQNFAGCVCCRAVLLHMNVGVACFLNILLHVCVLRCALLGRTSVHRVIRS